MHFKLAIVAASVAAVLPPPPPTPHGMGLGAQRGMAGEAAEGVGDGA